MLCKIPANYFISKGAGKQSFQNPFLRVLFHLLKNLFGLIFLLLGIVMFFTPGQGILTVLIGIILLDIPWKRRLERYFISTPKILSIVNAIRQKRNRAPLEL
ncbi:MAG: hypothetical protein ISS00_03255 [Candidatus Marinimicrobia bacterium]|nr:hypothetical protein [Candidatus Neomarinimicrobiota bacterium]